MIRAYPVRITAFGRAHFAAGKVRWFDMIPVRNWWHMLLYAWDLVEFEDRFETEFEDAPELRALLTKILVFLIKHQMRRGLRGDYVERSEELRGVRGRIDFGETLRGLSMYRGRLHCEFEEFTLNVPRNQIIRSTLNDSLNRGFTQVERERRDKYGKLVSDVEALLRMLYEIDRVRVTRRLIASELRLLGRNEREYKLMLKICELLLDPSMPRSDEASDLDYVDWLRENEDEHKIFELFVANFYKLHMRGKGWDVTAQARRYWVKRHERTDSGVRLPTMNPDIVLIETESGEVVVIDTKWYGAVLSDRSGRPTVNSEHLFQIYSYLQSLDGNDERFRDASGILLYARTEMDDVDFRTKIDGHPLRVYTLDLTKKRWQDIEDDLARLVEETVGS